MQPRACRLLLRYKARFMLPVLSKAIVGCAILVPTLAWGGRPLDTEDTGTVSPGRVEIELSGSYASGDAETRGGLVAVLSAGLAPALEVKVEPQLLQVVDVDGEPLHSGLGDTLLGAKYRLLDQGESPVAALAAVSVRLPTGDADRGLGTDHVHAGGLAALSRSIGRTTLTWNGGYTFVTRDRDLEAWLLAGSVEHALTETWMPVAEVVASVAAREAGDTVVLRAGMVHAITSKVSLDAAVGFRLTGPAPDVTATAGVTIAP
jgi:hypothetical protein